jgi:hypothetical protein
MSESHWTARDFLKAACEFERMTPNRNSWTEQSLASNPPRLVRLQRLRALAKAFDVQPGFEDLWSGDFIEKRPFERYELFRQRVLSDCETRFPGVLRSARSPLQLRDVESIYRQLFQFLARHAYPMLDVNGGVLEASGFYLYPLYRVDVALAGIPEAIRPLEELVGLVIEPDGRSFSSRELAEHGWPEVDLHALDADWLLGSFERASNER